MGTTTTARAESTGARAPSEVRVGAGKPAAPVVGITGVWSDPADSHAAHGIPYSLAPALERLGVYGGYRECFPPEVVARVVRRTATMPGRRRQGPWLLGREMSMVWSASNAVRRLTTPQSVDGWVLTAPVPIVRGRAAIFTDQGPYQFFHRTPGRPSAADWAPGATPDQLAACERRAINVYRSAHVCCVTSHWAGQSLVEDDGVDPKRVKVVGFGPGAEYKPNLAAAEARDWHAPRFLFVGGEWERKNGPAVVRALGRVREFEPQATLDVVGGHPSLCVDGVRTHGQLSRSRPEERAKLDRLFAEATCFVMPSVVEPFGMVHVEAGAAGLPSIATSVGGAADAIGPGGILADPTDEGSLVDAMLRMCNPAVAASFGGLARSYAALLTWDAIAQRIVRALGLEVPGVELADFL